MVRLKIDGKEIEADAGQNVLTAALDAGIYIPHLCSHPDLPELSSCRLCVDRGMIFLESGCWRFSQSEVY